MKLTRKKIRSLQSGWIDYIATENKRQTRAKAIIFLPSSNLRTHKSVLAEGGLLN